MSGIFDQLPDIGAIEDLRNAIGADFQNAISIVPQSDTDILGNLPSDLSGILDLIPDNSVSPVDPLASFFSSVQSDMGLDLTEPLQTIVNGLVQIQNNISASAIGELVFANGETRDIKDILLERVPDLTSQLTSGVTSMRDSVLTNERVQAVIDFVETIEAFTSNLPTEAEEIVGLLAQGFVGLPASLLSGPLDLAKPLLAQLQGAASVATSSNLEAQIQLQTTRMSSLMSVITDMDISAEADLQAVLDGLTSIHADLPPLLSSFDGLISDIGDRVENLDFSQFEADFGAAVESIPDFDISSLDDIKESLLSPFRKINQLFGTVSEEEILIRIRDLFAYITTGLEESNFSSWQTDIFGFFEEIKNALEALDLNTIQTQIEDVFNAINQKITDLGDDFKQTLLDGMRSVLSPVENTLDFIDLTAVNSAINDLFDQLSTALESISFGDLQSQLVGAFGTLDTVIVDLVAQTQSLADQLNDMISNLGDIQFDAVTDSVIEEIESLTEKLNEIDPDSLSDFQKTALAAAAAVLQGVNFPETVTSYLSQSCYDVMALPQEPLQLLAERVDALINMVAAFDPELIVAPLNDAYNTILEPIDSLDAATLITPLKEVLDNAKEAINAFSPTQLKAPLDDLFSPLIQEFDALSPTELLSPLLSVFEDIEDKIQKIDLTALLEELQSLIDDLFDQAKSEMLSHIQDLGLPEPITDFLSSLTSLLDLISPSLFVDPAANFMNMLDNIVESFNPGDIFLPLQALYDQLIAILNKVADDLLVDALEEVRTKLADAIALVDPANLSSNINVLTGSIKRSVSSLNPSALFTNISNSYQSLYNAFNSLDASSVPVELQSVYDQIQDLLSVLNPQGSLDENQAAYDSLLSQTDALGDISLGTLSFLFAPIRAKIDKMIPDFLRQEITAESLTSIFDSLRPDLIAAEVNAEFDTFKDHYQSIKPQLASEIESFFEGARSALFFLNFQALAEAFQGIYEAITSNLLALSPTNLISSIQGTFDSLKDQLEALNPVFIVEELEETFDRVMSKLDDLGLESVETNLDATLQLVKDNLTILNPVEILRESGILDTFEALQVALSNLSITSVVEQLDEALQAICAELRSELEKTESSFDRMLSAIPSQLSVSIGF